MMNDVPNRDVSEKAAEARETYLSGFNCAQSVSCVFAQKYDVERETALKMACGFGGGMRRAEVCGAVSGAIIVIGMCYPYNSADKLENKQICYEKTLEFEKEFSKRNGSIICRELLGEDLSTVDGYQRCMEKNLFKTTCVDMVVSAVHILEELGY